MGNQYQPMHGLAGIWFATKSSAWTKPWKSQKSILGIRPERIRRYSKDNKKRLVGITIKKELDMLSESKYKSQKVSRNRLSKLMRWILEHTGNGIDRGEIIARYYGLEQRYRGFYTDPCLRGKEQKEYERQYHLVQPVVSRTLRRLERRGLVQSMRHERYIKRIQLTAEGKIIAEELIRTCSRRFEGVSNPTLSEV